MLSYLSHILWMADHTVCVMCELVQQIRINYMADPTICWCCCHATRPGRTRINPIQVQIQSNYLDLILDPNILLDLDLDQDSVFVPSPNPNPWIQIHPAPHATLVSGNLRWLCCKVHQGQTLFTSPRILQYTQVQMGTLGGNWFKHL